MTTTIVTPWYGHMELAKDFWKAMRVARARVLVIDDGSDPPLPNAVRIPRSGFSRACNVGLEFARTDAVLFVNNDVFAVDADWLQRLEAAMEAGILVGAQLRSDPHASVDGVPMPYLDGWCMGGLREDLLELRGFDEDYAEPAYFSDNDLCLRARAAGMTLREVRTGLRHKINGSTRIDDPRTIEATKLNRDRFISRVRELLAGEMT